MARVPQTLSVGTISDDTLTELYEVPAVKVATVFLSVTNTSTTKIDISVYINDGATDRIFRKKSLPAGEGKEIFFNELANHKLNPGYKLKIQSNSPSITFNWILSGSVIDIN